MKGASAGDCLGIPFEFKALELEGSTIKYLVPSKEKIKIFIMDLLNEGNFYIMSFKSLILIIIFKYS